MSNAISYSRYGTHKQCPAKYAHRYVWSTPFIPQPSSPAAGRGKKIHKSIENFLMHEQDYMMPEVKHYAPYIREMRDRIAMPELQYCFNSEWKPVEWDSEDGYARGILDLALVEKSKATVDDWKTGRIYDDHVDQRSLYGLFMLSAYPEVTTVDVGNVYIDKPKEKRHSTIMTRDLLMTYQDTWDKRFKKMGLPLYPERPGQHCQWCDYSKKKGGVCPVG